MTQFQHMHHVMANKAHMQAAYAEGLIDDLPKLRARTREIVLSGAADYRSRWENIVVTDADREIVLQYLHA